MIKFSLRELEREIVALLKIYATGEDFDFKYPLDVDATNFGYVFGNIVDVALYNEPFYFQFRFTANKKSDFMQVGIKLMIGDVKKETDIASLLSLINELNVNLLFAKAVLKTEEAETYLVIDREFSAVNMEQVSEDIYDFFGDFVDEDVSPVIDKILPFLE
ncbi:MAG TPA: hypothetical protein VFD05_00060 [Bacilli bacterium]|nr:hypothetical protein [Bacilli bacterium]